MSEPQWHDDERDALLLQVAQLYYEENQTQEQIGRGLHLTRWKVGRLLAEAREAGIVHITIVHPLARRYGLERSLQARYGLRHAIVVSAAPDGTDAELRDQVARAAADYLAELRPRLLGVSWGRTLDALARQVRPGWTRDVHVVQINGGLSRSRRPTSAADMASTIAQRGAGTVTLLPAPAIVEQHATRAALEDDRSVAEVLQLARSADAHLFSFGAMAADSVLVESGYLTSATVSGLAERGAVGDVLSRFITADGALADTELDGRTLGLRLDDLRDARCSIAVAAGDAKHEVCRSVLRARLCTVLITDDRTARYLVEAR